MLLLSVQKNVEEIHDRLVADEKTWVEKRVYHLQSLVLILLCCHNPCHLERSKKYENNIKFLKSVNLSTSQHVRNTQTITPELQITNFNIL